MKRKDIIVGVAIALLLAGISFIAATSPDGLERVAEDRNFIELATNIVKSPIPDYSFPGVNDEKLAGGLAGIAGVIIVFFSGVGIARLLRER